MIPVSEKGILITFGSEENIARPGRLAASQSKKLEVKKVKPPAFQRRGLYTYLSNAL
jgi:hypothetical protein